MRSLLLAAALVAAPAAAQHEGHATPAPTTPAPATPPAGGYAGHEAPAQTAPATPAEKLGTDLEPGSGSAPDVPTDRYADRFWSPEAMARAKDQMHAEHGAMPYSMIMLDLAEIQIQEGREGYRFEGEASFGGDINRLWLKSEGEGRFGERMEALEVQALYSRAIDAYWNLQAGVRHDFQPDPDRTYATIGVEGLAPYWFELEGALFLSNKGDLLARIEGNYDQRITNRLILQPRAEANFAAQDVAATGVGSGLSDLELGLRLRYQFVPEFAPYVGVSWERKFGDTARFARAAGEERTSKGLVIGLRTWF